ncbi:hypothetical protein INN71_01930 [Nocardioides sp. ChNu-153]|uniref:hypothetical protein n=1 Tax=unclassified Nocardioides TaxID=2615069 RepID=UPI0024063C0A|nr:MULTISPECIES: hypothetical protein [unclassified Nocardioides]MDF9714729.1 hypothetical protein [Nocardioides sp. ChNu-99]MDN7120143.1 hypothetical protein [Nocardioides sp. ChNu-153]
MDDDRPGDDAGLWRLHGLVPAAEEVDLREELERDRTVERALRRLDVPVPADEPEEPEEPEVNGPPVTDGQALGILEHLLGAEPEDPEGE